MQAAQPLERIRVLGSQPLPMLERTLGFPQRLLDISGSPGNPAQICPGRTEVVVHTNGFDDLQAVLRQLAHARGVATPSMDDREVGQAAGLERAIPGSL